MLKYLLPALLIAAVLTSCSSLKPVTYTTAPAHRPATSPATAANKPANQKAKEVKFLNDINVTAATAETKDLAAVPVAPDRPEGIRSGPSAGATGAEKASAVQLKYAVLLNTEVEMLSDMHLLEYVDEWYGTRYRLGGTTKSGIDCSAFVQAVYLAAFGISLPRTAREQYRVSKIISATELKEGDLLFFNTIGGVSHVGIYLTNNKFIHASSSRGVAVSDIFDPYYLRKYLGAGRIEKPDAKLRSASPAETAVR